MSKNLFTNSPWAGFNNNESQEPAEFEDRPRLASPDALKDGRINLVSTEMEPVAN